jgi:hypothetical protein
MIWKLLLTTLLLLGGYRVIRSRYGASATGGGRGASRPQWLPAARTIRRLALAFLGLAAAGTLLHLIGWWQQKEEIVVLQVINANTGAITVYQARRGRIEGRRFQTLDGREIRMADVERMIILPARQD